MINALRMMKHYVEAQLGATLGSEDGQGMVEYGLIIGVISIILIAAFLTTGVAGAVTNLANEIIVGLEKGIGTF